LRGHWPLSTIPPDQIATTFGVRWLERKLTTAVRVQLVDAKKAKDIPDRDGDGIPDILPTAGYSLVNLYVGYQINPDTLASLSVDNLLDKFYVPYLAGTPNIPGNPPGVVFPGAGITIKGSLTARFGA
jgi:hemoglobin/transferrin/lactoferrin receptor protein